MYPAAKHTRSFGDLLAHQIGVTSEPEFKLIEVGDEELCFTIANEAAWKQITSEEITTIARFTKNQVSMDLITDKIATNRADAKRQGMPYPDDPVTLVVASFNN
jgi:hypothetical protein